MAELDNLLEAIQNLYRVVYVVEEMHAEYGERTALWCCNSVQSALEKARQALEFDFTDAQSLEAMEVDRTIESDEYCNVYIKITKCKVK